MHAEYDIIGRPEKNTEVIKLKKKYIALTAALMMLLCLLCACGKDEAETPEETLNPPAVNTEAPSAEPTAAPEQSSTELAETADAGDDYISRLVFIGDSTTYGLKAYDVLDGSQVWTPSSGTLALFNQSIATIVYPATGEEIPITDAIGRAKPEYVVLTIGVNGVSMMDEEQFKSEYTALIERIQSVSPDTKIICNSIYPVEASYEAKDNGINNTVIDRANGWILEIAEATGTHYTNSASVLKGSDGKLVSEYGNGDGIHLCAAGFERVLDYLKTHAWL